MQNKLYLVRDNDKQIIPVELLLLLHAVFQVNAVIIREQTSGMFHQYSHYKDPRIIFHNVLHLITAVTVVQAAHFRGGSISWHVASTILTNADSITIEIEQTYSWAYSRYPCGSLIGDADNVKCISSNCSNYNSTLVGTQTPCINFDLSLDLSTGHSTTPIMLTAGIHLVLAYNGANWLQLISSASGASWSLITSIDLRIRKDTGRINAAPTASMIGLITVPVALVQILRVPIADVDLDIVKCRWANSTAVIDSTVVNECGGVCQNIPGAQLYSSSDTLNNNCTLIFTSSLAGYYVVALQIEDFMPSSSHGAPLSSVPLQFLVLAMNVSCNQPIIVGQLPNGATIGVEANNIFTMIIFAQPGCNTTFIDHFSLITQPSGVVNISTVISLGSMLYSIQFIWTPNSNLIGSTQIYCTMATDSNNLQSNEYCLNFVVLGSINTTTTTQIVTIIETTNDLSLVFGLGLSLALLSLLSALLLCGCCCCWYQGYCWNKSQQNSCKERNMVREQTQSSQLDRRPMTDTSGIYDNSPERFQPKYSQNISISPTNESPDDFSGDFRQQYLKNNTVTLAEGLPSLSNQMIRGTPQTGIPIQIRRGTEQSSAKSITSVVIHPYMDQDRLTMN